MIELEFTGEEPGKVIGTNFVTSSTIDIIGFNVIPWIESNTSKNKDRLNEIGTKLLGKDVNGRLFVTLLCPTTNKKFWNISCKTIKNMIKILENEEIVGNISKGLLPDDMYTNPYLQMRKFLNK